MLTAHIVTLPNILILLVSVAAFCFVASGAYLINDMVDLIADRQHRTKRHRPIASGELSLRQARILVAMVVFVGLGLAAFVSLDFFICAVLYLAATLAYSLYIKRHPIVDVMMLAGLYTLRVVAGGASLGIPVSAWLLAFCQFLFLCLALIKRVIELQSQGGNIAASGRGYRAGDLPLIEMLAVAAGYASVLVLALYTSSPVVVTLYTYPEGLWVVCVLLLYWITRVLLLAHRGEIQDDPVLFVLRDRLSLWMLLVIAVVVGVCT